MYRQDLEASRKKGRVLTLVVQNKWFEMYLENYKKEDYRAITPYWDKRLLQFYSGDYTNPTYKEFDFVDIRNGYTKKRIVFKCDGIEIKKPNPYWSPTEFHNIDFFAIKMGRMCFSENVYPHIDRMLAEKTLDENYF